MMIKTDRLSIRRVRTDDRIAIQDIWAEAAFMHNMTSPMLWMTSLFPSEFQSGLPFRIAINLLEEGCQIVIIRNPGISYSRIIL